MINSLVEKALDSAICLFLPIGLVRPRTTFAEDVFAVCFVLNNGEKIFTHFTWDRQSAEQTVEVLQLVVPKANEA